MDEIHARFELPNATPHYARDLDFVIKHLRLDIEVDIEGKYLKGVAFYTLMPLEDVELREIVLDACELNIKSVKLNGKRATFEHVGDKLFIAVTKTQGRITVAVEYDAHPEMGLHFVLPDRDHPERYLQAWTQGEDEYSKYWFPCFDAPNMKYTTEMRITVKEQFTAISNGRLLAVKHDRRRHRKTFHWKEDVPHSTYLNSVVVGTFSLIEEKYRNIPVQYYVRPGREEEAKRSFGKTPDMMKFFSEYIGVEYPYEKYAQVAVSEFIWGGMENISATTQTDDTLHDERAERDFPSHPLVAHELAHQWWGDLLTTKDWSHIWLNEGFATFFEALYREHDEGEEEYEYYVDHMASLYFEEDRGHYRRPIVQRKYLVPTELFDRTTYQKGAVVLHMLRNELGEHLFRRAINSYCRENMQRNVETQDLIRAIERSTGRNMQLFFDQWVYAGGYPELSVNYSYDRENAEAELFFRQTQVTDEVTPLFAFDLEISISSSEGKRENRKIRIEEKECRIAIKAERRPRFISIDPHNRVLKKLDYQRSVEDAICQLKEGGAFEKIQAARELGRKPRASTVEALKNELQKENFWGVKAECCLALGKMNREDALQALLNAEIEDSRARKFKASALGNYLREESLNALEGMLEDESYAVQAEALSSIARFRNVRAMELLKRGLGMNSHNEVVRQAAINSIGEIGSVDDIGVVLAFTEARNAVRVRSAAIKAVARLGRSSPRYRDFVYEQLKAPSRVYRMAAIEAAAITENRDAILHLDALISREKDGMAKRAAYDAIARIRRLLERPEEIGVLEKRVDDLMGMLMELRGRIESIEFNRVRK